MGGGANSGVLLFSTNTDYIWQNNAYIATNCHTDEYDYFIVKIAYNHESTPPKGAAYVYVEKNQSQWVNTDVGSASHSRTFVVDDTGVKSTSASRTDRAIVIELYGFKSAPI